jgi:hypothetical protein
VPAGTYTLLTVPRKSSVDLIVNTQTGQWGTQYSPSHDLGRAPMMIDTVKTPVEKFTISIRSADARHGALVMEWGDMHWTAPIVVQ